MCMRCSWIPVYADENQRLSCMSIGFLLQSKNDSVVWRGPKKNGKNLSQKEIEYINSLKSHDQTVFTRCLLGRIRLFVD